MRVSHACLVCEWSQHNLLVEDDLKDQLKEVEEELNLVSYEIESLLARQSEVCVCVYMRGNMSLLSPMQPARVEEAKDTERLYAFNYDRYF